LPAPLFVDWDMGEEICSNARRPPAPRGCPAEWLGQATFPGVLQLVKSTAGNTRERRAPLELQERTRDLRRQADGNSGGSAVAPMEGRQAARADRTALDATTRAGGRQRRVKQSCPEAAQMELTAYPPAQAMILASSTSPAIAWRTVGTAEGARSG